MNVWKILELEPTIDIRSIKKAYSKKLKIYHPEDNAEAYQKIREAYDSALKQVKEGVVFESPHELYEEASCDALIEYNELMTPNNYDQNEHHHKTSNGYFDSVTYELNSKTDLLSQEIEIQNIIERVQSLYNDYEQRLKLNNWEELLSSEVFWKLDCREALFWSITQAIIQMPHIPTFVWPVLNTHIHWTHREQDICAIVGDYGASVFIDRITSRRPFIYHSAHHLNNNIDNYYEQLDKIQIMLKDRQLENARELLISAMRRHQNDPNLHLLYGEYALYAKLTRDRYNHFKHVKVLNPENISMRLYIAQKLLQANMETQAVEEYEELLIFDSNNLEALFKTSEYCLKNERIKEAYHKCMKLIYLYPNDLSVLALSNEVMHYLVTAFKEKPFNLNFKKMILELNSETGTQYPSHLFSQKKHLSLIGLKLLKISKAIAIGLIIFGLIIGVVIFMCSLPE